MNRKNAVLAVDAAVSIAVLVAVAYLLGIDRLLSALAGTDPVLLLISILFLLVMDIAMAYRIHILLKDMGSGIRYGGALMSHMVGMLLADFTPARSGYFATVANLRYAYGVPSEKGLAAIMGPQVFDFALKVIAGTAGFFLLVLYAASPSDLWLVAASAMLMFLMISTMLLLLFSRRFLGFLFPLKQVPFAGKLVAVFERMQLHSGSIIRKTPELLVLLIVTWSAKAVSWYFVAKSLGISVGGLWFPEVFFYFLLQPMLTLLEFIPSPTIAGLGLSEGGGALVFSLFGVQPAIGAAFVLLARAKTMLINMVAVPETLRLLKETDYSALFRDD